jgi:hypothetical protein
MTPRRIAAARRRLAREREAVALLPDLAAQVATLEEDLAGSKIGGVQADAAVRARWACDWRRARRLLAAVPEPTRRGLLRYWNTWGGPSTSEYLLTFIHQAMVGGRSFWTDLRIRRQMYLIGQGRYPKDRIALVFASNGGSGVFKQPREPEFYDIRRRAKQLRRAGQLVATGRAVQMHL